MVGLGWDETLPQPTNQPERARFYIFIKGYTELRGMQFAEQNKKIFDIHDFDYWLCNSRELHEFISTLLLLGIDFRGFGFNLEHNHGNVY